VNAPLSVTAMAPENEETVDGVPPQIMIAFNHDLDVSQLSTHALHIERLAHNATQPVQRIAARIAVSSANLRAVMIWPSSTLSSGRYRVVLDAGSSAQFSDIAGRSVVLGIADAAGETVISTFDVEVVP
jgi:hypothetical protein